MFVFVYIYPLDSDLSGEYRYPTFEQLGPDVPGLSTGSLNLIWSQEENFALIGSTVDYVIVDPSARLNNLVPRAHVSFCHRQETESWR